VQGVLAELRDGFVVGEVVPAGEDGARVVIG